MKNLFKQPLYLALMGLGLFLSSCGTDDDDVTPEVTGPSISATSDSIFVNADVTRELNESEWLVVRLTAVKGDAALASVSITKDGSALDASAVYFSDFDAASDTTTSTVTLGGTDVDGFTGDIKIWVDATVTGSSIYTVTVTDADNVATEFSVILTISAEGLSTAKTGRIIYNASGPNAGAFDLDGDSTTASTGPTSSDLQDQGTATWAGEIAPENGAMWVAASLSDYTSGTLSSITDLYAAGTPSATAQAISVDDVFIVMTSEGAMSIVRFTEVNDIIADNTDNYVFAYKLAL